VIEYHALQEVDTVAHLLSRTLQRAFITQLPGYTVRLPIFDFMRIPFWTTLSKLQSIVPHLYRRVLRLDCRRRVELSSSVHNVAVETGVVVVERVVHSVSVRQLDPQPISSLQRNDAGVGSGSGTLGTGDITRARCSRRRSATRTARIVERRQLSLAVSNQVQKDILAVIPDPAKPDQVRAVDGRREDAGRRAVSASVVDQNHVEAHNAIFSRARQIVVEGCRERDDRCSIVSWVIRRRSTITLLALRTVTPCSPISTHLQGGPKK